MSSVVWLIFVEANFLFAARRFSALDFYFSVKFTVARTSAEEAAM